MKINKMYNELLLTSLVLNIFDSILTAAAIFSMAYFILSFYRISYLVAVIIAFVIFVRSLYQKIKQNKILLLEHKYPDLKERLRTSYDYQQKSNTVINELHSDVVSMMKRVDVNAFLDNKKLFFKILTVTTVLMSTLYLASIGLDVIDVKNAVIDSTIYKRTSSAVNNIFDRDEIRNRPLLDNPSLVGLGDNEKNISIETYNTELDISEITDEKSDYGGHFPEEVSGAAQLTYEEKIPEEHKEVIKEYFKKINK